MGDHTFAINKMLCEDDLSPDMLINLMQNCCYDAFNPRVDKAV